MTKTDLKKTFDGFRAKAGEFRTLELPPVTYLMADGAGDPNTTPAYREALEALYPLGYSLKFASARQLGRDYVVPPLEGLWWAEDMTAFTEARDKSRWSWTMMLMVPEWVPRDLFDEAVRTVSAKKEPPRRVADVRWERLDEGRCVQTLHVGSYDDEGPVLEHLHHRVIPDAGLRMTGHHHEIYLSDARRVAPERLRTILRQPVEVA